MRNALRLGVPVGMLKAGYGRCSGGFSLSRGLAFGAAALIALPAAVNAAEIYSAGPGGYKDVAAPYTNWTGAYIGAEGGFGWGTTSSNVFTTFPASFEGHASEHNEGGLGGFVLGYNWMATPSWLVGIEADATAGGVDANSTACVNPSGVCAQTVSSIIALATIRGRAGFVWDNVLIYGTGGVAFVESNVTRNNLTVGVSGQSDDGAVGWAAGGGIEYAIRPNLSFKVEYLLVEYSVSHDFTSSLNEHTSNETQIDIVRAGIAYHYNPAPAPLK
jgi:outer membrane immunogenic protein